MVLRPIPFRTDYHILRISYIYPLEIKLNIIIQRPLYSMFGIPLMHNLHMSSLTSQFRRTSTQHSFSRCSNNNRLNYISGRRISSRSFLTTQRHLGTGIVATYPEPETEKERSPIDFPQVSPISILTVWLLYLSVFSEKVLQLLRHIWP